MTTRRRYLMAVGSLLVTLASIVVLLFTGVASTPLLIVAAVGAPISALLLAIAAAAGDHVPGRWVGSALVGATVIPALVLLAYGVVSGAIFALVAPLSDAGRDLFDSLEVDPDLLDVLTNPWSLAFLVELAVLAPLVEEGLKPLAARLFRPRSRSDAFILGAAAGAGFAAIENILYASGWLFSTSYWLPIAVLRSSGAAIHLVGAGLVSVAVFEWRSGRASGMGVVRSFGLAGAIHAMWNGTIAVAIILFGSRSQIAGGLGGTALSWGVTMSVLLAGIGVLALGALVVVGRWAASDEPRTSLLASISFERPSVVAGWATLCAAMLIPAVVMILVFPDFVAL